MELVLVLSNVNHSVISKYEFLILVFSSADLLTTSNAPTTTATSDAYTVETSTTYCATSDTYTFETSTSYSAIPPQLLL